jgi:hypothetical protein
MIQFSCGVYWSEPMTTAIQKAIAIHAQAQKAVNELGLDVPDATVDRVCSREYEAFQAVLAATPRDLRDAANRCLYVEQHLRVAYGNGVPDFLRLAVQSLAA